MKAVAPPRAPCSTIGPQKALPRLSVLRAPRNVITASSDRDAQLLTGAQKALQSVLQKAAAFGCAASLLLSAPAVADEGGIVLRLPASDDPEVFQTQQTMFEAWTIVGDTFVDDTFNGHYWPDELKTHMMAAFLSNNGKAAYGEISNMLDDLGDPYTRIIPPSEYADFRVSSDGELQGVGLLIANQPVNNHLLVLSAIKGGPADRAGITSGDEVISINDQSTEGWTGDMAAKLLRGKGGTEVRVRFARRTEGIPGVPGRPEPPLASATVREVRLKREKLALSPLYYTALQAPELTGASSSEGFSIATAPPLEPTASAAAAAALSSSAFIQDTSSSSSQPWAMTATSAMATAGGVGQAAPAERVGYLRLTSFSQNAAEDTKRAIMDLEHKGVSGYILDLRDNPGGLVKAGIDIARLLLDGHPTVFSITGREGEPVQQVVLGSEEDPGGSGEALTKRPLVVLVNKNSASASEILSGALHDNNRATIVGDNNTYGKGRIQSVYELHDGSALFVTVAKYVTPNGTVIDHQGLRPDLSCGIDLPNQSGDGANGEDGLDGAMAAFLPGMPIGPGSESAMVAALSRDKCVMQAADVLHKKAKMISATAKVAATLPRRL